MKALQGKKTSLRSILRWGLVLFSLAALVLAGCNSGSDDDDGGGGGIRGTGKDILTMKVIKAPDYISYEGLPIDLRGIEVLVTYTDGTWEVLTDQTAKFFTVPNADAIEPGRVCDTYRVGEKIERRYDTATGDTPSLMKIPEDYIFAEYRILDYMLAYNPNNKMTGGDYS